MQRRDRTQRPRTPGTRDCRMKITVERDHCGTRTVTSTTCCREARERQTPRSSRSGAPGAHLAARMGTYPAHGRISMTEIGGGHALQCHLALSRNRPEEGEMRQIVNTVKRVQAGAASSRVAGYGHRSPRLKVIASKGRMLTGSSSFAVAMSTHSPSRSSNASKVRSVGSTSHRWPTPASA